MGSLDLHIHSSWSNDGEFTPTSVLDRCNTLKMKYISITDHNSVGGIEDAVKYGNQIGIKVIPGIEIDCSFNDMNLHLLGYNIDYKLPEFHHLNEEMNEKELSLVSQMIKNIKELGFRVEYEEVLEKAGAAIPVGEFIAEIIMDKPENKENAKLIPYRQGGIRSDNPYLNFYRDFFAKGKPAYVTIQYMDLKNAVNLVIKTGGIPILAHPGESIRKDIARNLDQIIAVGVKGLEVFSSYHTEKQTKYFLDYTKKKNTIFTAGSDFHGKNKPAICLGTNSDKSLENEIISQICLISRS